MPKDRSLNGDLYKEFDDDDLDEDLEDDFDDDDDDDDDILGNGFYVLEEGDDY